MSSNPLPPELSVVRVEIEGPIGRLTLNRPEKINALSLELLEEVIVASEWFTEQEEVKVVVVSGAGRAFSAGSDLAAFGNVDPEAGEDAYRDAVDLGRRAADALTDTRPLTIAAIHGHCVGGGLVLAAACDLRVAAEDTTFLIPEVDLGIPLAWGGIPRLVREIGPAVTKELVLTCRPFSATEAKQLGFLNRVVSPDEVPGVATDLAQQLAGQPAYSLELTKRQVNRVAEESGSTAESAKDADLTLGALADRESLEKMQSYLAGH
ncbi:MAG: enoyl-CoA hydratase/isomerase family protein [Solirubrobacterales bacterium]|nr:enoyl-CoA hydratase/isomerase family protein [Solirubrobacterales bacterium]